jgi:hypothetical protein
MELVGEAVTETKKVQDFLANIKDPTLQMGVTHCFGEPEKLNSLESCQQYLSTLATTTRAYKEAGSAARSVSSASTGTGSKSSGGKGTKRKGGKRQTNTKGYSNEEWWAMSDAERAAVVKARKEAGGKSKKKAKRIARPLSPEWTPEMGTVTAVPQLQRQRQQTQVTSLGAELILERAETEAAATPTRTDDRSKWSPLAPLSG